MKLKKIEKICKASRSVHIYDDVFTVGDESGLDCQWIGDGSAVYAIDGAPYLDENGVRVLFDTCEGEEPLEPVELKMSLGGIPLYLLRDVSGSMIVIRDVYRTPFDDWGACTCYKRIGASGEPYVAVKTGFVLRGVILPYNCITDSFVDALKAAHKAAGVSVAKQRQEEQRQEEQLRI